MEKRAELCVEIPGHCKQRFPGAAGGFKTGGNQRVGDAPVDEFEGQLALIPMLAQQRHVRLPVDFAQKGQQVLILAVVVVVYVGADQVGRGLPERVQHAVSEGAARVAEIPAAAHLGRMEALDDREQLLYARGISVFPINFREGLVLEQVLNRHDQPVFRGEVHPGRKKVTGVAEDLLLVAAACRAILVGVYHDVFCAQYARGFKRAPVVLGEQRRLVGAVAVNGACVCSTDRPAASSASR